MKISAVGFSHIGTVRSKNQDAALIHDQIFTSGMIDMKIDEASRFFVADGVGGAPAGEVASNYVLSEMNLRFELNSFPDQEEIIETLNEINNDLRKYGSSDLHTSGMATTLSGLFISGKKFRLINAGDSRVMVLRDGYLVQLTKDDIIDIHEIYRPITSFFGGAPDEVASLSVHVETNEWIDGDIFLVTSDGIFHCFSEDQLASIMSNSKSLIDNANLILKKALSSGSPDNISCIFFKVTEK